MFSRLEGIEAKLDRAQEHMEMLDTAFQTWVDEEEPWGADREVCEGKRRYIFILKVLKPIPPRFAVIYGEIVHDMRSALDHLACHLVERSGKGVTNSTAWPIKKSRFSWARNVERRHRPWHLWRKKGGGPLKGIPFGGDAWTLIERSQPYIRSDDAGNDPLWGLEELWNTDKHRLLNAMPAFTTREAVLAVFGATGSIEPVEARALVTPNRALADGAKLAIYILPSTRPMPEMKMKGNLAMEIAIGDDEGKERPLLRDTLQIIRQIVAEAKAL